MKNRHAGRSRALIDVQLQLRRLPTHVLRGLSLGSGARARGVRVHHGDHLDFFMMLQILAFKSR